MLKYTPGDARDRELEDPRMMRPVSRAERQVFERLENMRDSEGYRFRNLFNRHRFFRDPLGIGSDARRRRQYRWEAEQQVLDQPKGERKRHIREERLQSAERMAIPEERLRDIALPYPETTSTMTAQMNNAAGTPRDVTVRVEVRHDGWWDRVLREARSPEWIAGEIAGKGEPQLREMGITIDVLGGNLFQPFTQQQAEAIVHSRELAPFFAMANLRRAFSADGVSEFNVQMALQFASEHPEEIAKVVIRDRATLEKDMEKIRAQADTAGLLEDIGRMERKTDAESMQEAEDQSKLIQQDLKNLGAMIGNSQSSCLGAGLVDFAALNPALRSSHRSTLINEQRRLTQLFNHYNTLKNRLETLRSKAGTASMGDLPRTFTALFQAARPELVDPALLNATVDPQHFAEEWKTALRVKARGEYDKQASEKEKELKDIEEGKKVMSGREAVIAAYEKHFALREGRALPEHREQAKELYARNMIGRQQVRSAMDSLNRAEVFGRGEADRGLVRWPAQQLKELALGSQEAFVCNLAESPAIGIKQGRGTGFLSLLRGTRRGGILWRKHAARPAWGSLKFDQLLTAFYALRESVNRGYANLSWTVEDASGNKITVPTQYVRDQMNEVVRILLRDHARRLVDQFDLNSEITDEEREQIEAGHQGKFFEEMIRARLEGPVDADYSASVESSINYAYTNTARIRKAVGGAVKAVAQKHKMVTAGTAIGAAAGFAAVGAGTAGLAVPVIAGGALAGALAFKAAKHAVPAVGGWIGSKLKAFWAWGTRKDRAIFGRGGG